MTAIQQKLKSHPFIESIIVNYKSPEVISIHVKEREPVASLVLEEGNIIFTDQTGRTMPYRLFDKFSDLPIIRNIGNGDKLDKGAISACLSVLNEFRNKENYFLYYFTSELIYNNNNGSIKIITRDKPVNIEFGHASDIKAKTEKLRIYWNNTNPLAQSSQVRFIDLKWDNYIVAG